MTYAGMPQVAAVSIPIQDVINSLQARASLDHRWGIGQGVPFCSPRGIGCARPPACGGPLRKQCLLRLGYLRAPADRSFESADQTAPCHQGAPRAPRCHWSGR